MENKISVWVGNWAYYNEGHLVGEWLNLPVEPEALQSFLTEEVLVDSLHEEYGIMDVDYDGYLKQLGFENADGSTLESLNMLAHLCDEAEDYELEAVSLMMEQEGTRCNALQYCNALLQAEDIPYCAYQTEISNYTSEEAALAYSEADASGLLSQLEDLGVADYVNWKELGEAWSQDFYLGEKGYLNARCPWPKLDEYPYEEVFEEVFGCKPESKAA